jgi:hypothetical protein
MLFPVTVIRTEYLNKGMAATMPDALACAARRVAR